MRQKNVLIFFLLILAGSLIAVTVYYNSPKYLEQGIWKYYGGYPSGDVIEFTLEQKSNELKVIQSQNAKKIVCFGGYMVVKNSQNGRLGYYKLKNGH